MRVVIFVGLIYIAWCINPTAFDTQMVTNDRIALTFTCMWAILGDLGVFNKSSKNRE